MQIFESFKEKLKGRGKVIVFPEGDDKRIVGAAARLKKEGLLEPLILGTEDEVRESAERAKTSSEGLKIINPKDYDKFEPLLSSFLERRKGKISESDARELLLNNNNYFGTMMVYDGLADGMVSGAIHSTGDTVRPALQIIKVKRGYTKVSGIILMVKDDKMYFFADCAININPKASELAEIAKQSHDTAMDYIDKPIIAMLSFSTKGSAKSEEVDEIIKATKLAQTLYPELIIDGELQFDAAMVPLVGSLKAPNSDVAGRANVFIFPSLEAGNIGYKIAQRMGAWEAVGPLLQGLNAPVNDLSRGCSQEDVYKLAIMTAIQSLQVR